MFEIKSGVKDPPNSEREDQYVHVVKHFHIWWTLFCLDCACTKGERGLGSGFLLFIYGIFYGISGGYYRATGDAGRGGSTANYSLTLFSLNIDSWKKLAATSGDSFFSHATSSTLHPRQSVTHLVGCSFEVA